MKINFDDPKFLDALQRECLRVQDDKFYTSGAKKLILEVGANIFALDIHKFGTIKKQLKLVENC